MLNYASSHGYGVSYMKAVHMETAIANAVIENSNQFGTYVPPNLNKETFAFYSMDNIDFNEDTPTGKHTTHATIICVHQIYNNTR